MLILFVAFHMPLMVYSFLEHMAQISALVDVWRNLVTGKYLY